VSDPSQRSQPVDPPSPARKTESDDRALRHAFRAGDSDAFRRLCEPLLDTLFTVCHRLTRNRAEAEDTAQDALIRALDRRHHYDPERPFRPWLLKIATNLCLDRIQRVWWRRVLPFGRTREPVPDDALPPTDGVDPDASLDAFVRDLKLRAALAELPHAYREAIVLFHLDDMSYAEMAEITGANVPALKQRVRRGLGMLRERLPEMYPELVPIRRAGET
jgi:RNA polymerase sigma-70 factor (ECF subfamily)